jgi:hypothetical protein
MAQQTLKKALYLLRSGQSRSLRIAANLLDGLPVGGWGETHQAWRQMIGELPVRAMRGYTADEFAESVYEVRNDRYHTREEYSI